MEINFQCNGYLILEIYIFNQFPVQEIIKILKRNPAQSLRRGSQMHISADMSSFEDKSGSSDMSGFTDKSANSEMSGFALCTHKRVKRVNFNII